MVSLGIHSHYRGKLLSRDSSWLARAAGSLRGLAVQLDHAACRVVLRDDAAVEGRAEVRVQLPGSAAHAACHPRGAADASLCAQG
ncbi:hypothetical protein D3C71_2113230 [compost metagenome]